LWFLSFFLSVFFFSVQVLKKKKSATRKINAEQLGRKNHSFTFSFALDVLPLGADSAKSGI